MCVCVCVCVCVLIFFFDLLFWFSPRDGHRLWQRELLGKGGKLWYLERGRLFGDPSAALRDDGWTARLTQTTLATHRSPRAVRGVETRGEVKTERPDTTVELQKYRIRCKLQVSNPVTHRKNGSVTYGGRVGVWHLGGNVGVWHLGAKHG